MTKLKKYIPSIVGFCAIVLVSQLLNNNSYSSRNNLDVSKLQQDVASIQANLPNKIDALSTVTAVSLEDKVLKYAVTLDGVYLMTDDIDKLKAMQQSSNIISACLSPNLINGLINGLALEYEYTVSTSGIIFETRVAGDDCKPFVNGSNEGVADYFIRLQNDTVPLPVDADTTLIYFERVDETIEIIYQLHNWEIDNLDVPYFVEVINSEVVPNTCSTPVFKVMSERGFSYVLKYYDSQFKLIHDFIVDDSSC